MKIEYGNGEMTEVPLPPEAAKVLLEQKRQLEEEQAKKKISELSEPLRRQGQAYQLGQLTQAVLQFFPGGTSLTTLTTAYANRYKKDSVTELFLGHFLPEKLITPIFEGSEKVLSFSQTRKIINLGLCKPQNLKTLYKGELAPTPPDESSNSFVEFLMGEDATLQKNSHALWSFHEVKDGLSSHYVIVHSNSGKLLTYTKNLWGSWSGYYCNIEEPYSDPKERNSEQPKKQSFKSLEKRFLWDIYYDKQKKAHLLRNIDEECHPGLLCYTENKSQNGGYYGQVLFQSMGTQFKVEEYYPNGTHRSSIEFRLPVYNDYSSSSSKGERQGKGDEKKTFHLQKPSDSWGEDDEENLYSVESSSNLTVHGLYRIVNCALSATGDGPDHLSTGLLLSTSEASQSGYYTAVLDAQHSKHEISDKRDLWRIGKTGNKFFTIRNYEGAYLTWVNKSTYSGFYGQTLEDNSSMMPFSNSYPKEKEKYELGGEFRKDVLWILEPSVYKGQEFYKIKNAGINFSSDELGGRLCYTSDTSSFGPYAQILSSSSSYLSKDKEKYKGPDGEFWPTLLWALLKDNADITDVD